MTPHLSVLAIAGSLRAGSFNRALLRAAVRHAPQGMQISIFDLSDIPLYNADLDTDEMRPESVTALKNRVVASDALLIATPEHNYSIPGVLKNALDWVSRPAFRSPLAGKPVALMGAAPGTVGTARAQGHLRQVLFSMLAEVVPHREMLVSQAKDKFDSNLDLVDERTAAAVSKLLKALADYVARSH